MHRRWASLLAFGSLCAPMGCRPPDLTQDQALAREQVTLHSEEESGQATEIFAQQEWKVAELKQAVEREKGVPVNAEPEQAAQQHLQAAELGLKLDRDRLQSASDAVALRQMLKADDTAQ